MLGHHGNYQLSYDYCLESPTSPLTLPTDDHHSVSVTFSSHYSLIPKNMQICSPNNSDYLVSTTSKVLSTPHDLQGINMGQHSQWSNSPLASESSIIESMIARASPYSPEEKKEKIARYRSKRNLRNFNKKIKYECRKTLADSRPRVRGRFARNDEIEKASQSQWDHTDDEDDDSWISFLHAFSANQMP